MDNNLKGLPWFHRQSEQERNQTVFYNQLEEIIGRINEIESDTDFASCLTMDSFIYRYQYVKARLRELKRYIMNNPESGYDSSLLEDLEDLTDVLEDLETDALLYEDFVDDTEYDTDFDSDDGYIDYPDEDFSDDDFSLYEDFDDE